jgi:hypothetical protein
MPVFVGTFYVHNMIYSQKGFYLRWVLADKKMILFQVIVLN